MRKALCESLERLYFEHRFMFFTGDLGFMALEPLRERMGLDFINAGIAEQNMVAVAAGVAFTSLQTWAYSIAPFAYARPFEQIRNDVCLQNLDVKIVGNGGGYGYGYMGATHHAIEDYGVLATLQNMTCYIPAFANDVLPIIWEMAYQHGPVYLRLGRHEMPENAEIPPYLPWRRLITGRRGVLIGIGPVVAQAYIAALSMNEYERPSVWVLTQMPLPLSLPDELTAELTRENTYLVVVEEHVAHGSAGMAIAHRLACLAMWPRFHHLCAVGYPAGKGYGTQQFHRVASGIDADSIGSFLRGIS